MHSIPTGGYLASLGARAEDLFHCHGRKTKKSFVVKDTSIGESCASSGTLWSRTTSLATMLMALLLRLSADSGCVDLRSEWPLVGPSIVEDAVLLEGASDDLLEVNLRGMVNDCVYIDVSILVTQNR